MWLTGQIWVTRTDYGRAVPNTPPSLFNSVPTWVLVVLVTVALILFVALIVQVSANDAEALHASPSHPSVC